MQNFRNFRGVTRPLTLASRGGEGQGRKTGLGRDRRKIEKGREGKKNGSPTHIIFSV